MPGKVPTKTQGLSQAAEDNPSGAGRGRAKEEMESGEGEWIGLWQQEIQTQGLGKAK